jgi:DNA-binding GntR family transcriptional regulator
MAGGGMTALQRTPREAIAPARVALAPLADTSTFADRAYAALKDVIVSLDVYSEPGDVRLDERLLASDLGISRTPVREAMAQLEREGFVRSVPRRGVYVVRKNKREVIELITAWAALESMAARLITQTASDAEIATLRAMFATFENGTLHAKLDEYSEVNIAFQAQDDRRTGSRRSLDPRSHEHHRGVGVARYRAGRRLGARPCARACRARGEVRRLSGLITRQRARCERGQ